MKKEIKVDVSKYCPPLIPGFKDIQAKIKLLKKPIGCGTMIGNEKCGCITTGGEWEIKLVGLNIHFVSYVETDKEMLENLKQQLVMLINGIKDYQKNN